MEGRNRSEAIRRFVVGNVQAHPRDIAKVVGREFGITREAVRHHLARLVGEGVLVAAGNTRARVYRLGTLVDETFRYRSMQQVAEDREWREKIAPLLPDLGRNVVGICEYGFTEMLNNVIDHADAQEAVVTVRRTATSVELRIHDDGVGIFHRIQQRLGLDDPRHALLELSKGKVTTDPARHTGEGIFFTSKMFDTFSILSGGLYYVQQNADDGWLIETVDEQHVAGTTITMRIAADAERRVQDVFDQFTGEDFSFSRTHVPVKLAQYGQDQLISRSAARRLLARFDRFSEVLLDFTGVESIGQAFADEIFRVYSREHPDVRIVAVAAAPLVQRMIRRANADAIIAEDGLKT